MNNYSRSNYFNPIFYPYKSEMRYRRLVNEYENIYQSRNLTDVVLKLGSNGVEVEELQNLLISLNYLKGKPDGYFGKSTENAVFNFQRDSNQIMDGIVGPITWEFLERAKNNPLPVNEPTIKEGDKNLFVTSLQFKLNALGFLSDQPDSNFGSKTAAAVKEFQRIHGLSVDGIVGPNTWRALNHAYSLIENPIPVIITPMTEGASGEEVTTLQKNLTALGYYSGEATSNFDVATEKSVQKFQEDNGLLPTGIVNQKTWELIEDKVLENRAVRSSLLRQKNVLSRPTLRLGDTGEDVRDLQYYLKELMYLDGPVDNKFGNNTNNAVRAFQNNNNLLVDGIVGRNTWSALINFYSPLAICETRDNDRYVGVVIDAGHGGDDPGAVSPQITEKDYNLKISQYIANRFAELGIPYALTRNSDETLTNTERINRLKTPFGDNTNVIAISNHINAGGGEGAEVIYPLRSNSKLAQNILTELGNAGQKMRTYYQKTLPNDPTKDYYYIMRDTDKMQTIITEYGFLDNPKDIEKLEKDWDKYAEAVVKAIAEYMGYPYSSPTQSKVTYIVRAGDSLWSIANRYGTTVDAIKQLNNLTSNNLKIGQQLIISGEEPSVPSPEGNIIHTVKAGDTLYSIASKYNTTVDEIKRKNSLTNNNLSIGQKLVISGEGIVPEIPIESSTYTVKAGDTLYSIAQKHNVSVDYLKRINNLTSNALSIGQKLIITDTNGGTPKESTVYVVKLGDTLWSIANNYGVSVDSIKVLNNLTNNILWAGQQLIISEEPIGPIFPNDKTIYVVKAGDTLWSIASKNNTTVDEIKKNNNLTSNSLSIGQELTLPGTAVNIQEPVEQTHTVKVGDTLWSLANQYGTTVNSLKQANNLTNNTLSIGQKLIIPSD